MPICDVSSNDPDDSQSSFFMTPENDKINDANMYKVLLTNARSLAPKIRSLHTIFEEHQIDVALITESWLHEHNLRDRDIIDLEYGTDMKIIYKHRPKTPAGARRVGGGVSIIYNKSRCNLRERRIVGNKFELVLAVGRVGKITRQAAFFCLYIEPRMKVGDLKQLGELIAGEILKLKAAGDPLIFLGGDVNRRDLDTALGDFPDITQINWEPTRGPACLDKMFSNATGLTPNNWPPLETPQGVKSDHMCLIVSGSVPRERDFVWIRKTTRKHSQQAVLAFEREMEGVNWTNLLHDGLSPDEMVAVLEKTTGEMIERLFPLRTIRCRSNESPWITNAIRRVSKQKCRIFKREGKSPFWHQTDQRLARMVAESKEEYVEATEGQGSNPRKFFQAIKKLSSRSAPAEWKLSDLFPDDDELAAGEKAADYFTHITDQFVPLAPEDMVVCPRRPVTPQEVAAKLMAAKKPCSSVEGDILPRLTKSYHHLLVAPATRIFNAIFSSSSWPARWKEETTVVIPKVGNPETLADCRNISCTAFLSKVLESIMLDDLRAEIPVDVLQYGGLKGCSVNHLLMDMYDNVLEPLDSGAYVTVLGIDYEKAFNRLDHSECLRQLEMLGASPQTLALIRSFLTGRVMRIRTSAGLSSPRTLCGGSPQGSILGCRLYCLTTQQLNLSLADTRAPVPALPQNLPMPPPGLDAPPEPLPGLDLDWVMPEVGATPPPSPSTPGSIEERAQEAQPSTPEIQSINKQQPAPVMFKYIDDTSVVEVINPEASIRHISSNKPCEAVQAPATDAALSALIDRADEIGVRVNCKKTQLVCISPDNGYDTTATVRAGNDLIPSQPSLKILGFMIGNRGVDEQVAMLRAKFRKKFWALIHLHRAGLRGARLFRMYAVLVRPVIEANSVIYHPMLTTAQAEEIERMQKLVVRLCFSHQRSYAQTIEEEEIDKLSTRRIKAVEKFTVKALANPRFAQRWFIRREDIDNNLRRRRPFVERRARTNRFRNSPLMNVQRVANDIMTR